MINKYGKGAPVKIYTAFQPICHVRSPWVLWNGTFYTFISPLFAEMLLKSERQHIYHIYWSVLTQISWKKFPWVICKILGLFVNALTADDKYSLVNRDNLLQDLQMQLSQKQKHFFNFFSHFPNLDSILNIFEKMMTLIADVFLKLGTRKNVIW